MLITFITINNYLKVFVTISKCLFYLKKKSLLFLKNVGFWAELQIVFRILKQFD